MNSRTLILSVLLGSESDFSLYDGSITSLFQKVSARLLLGMVGPIIVIFVILFCSGFRMSLGPIFFNGVLCSYVLYCVIH